MKKIIFLFFLVSGCSVAAMEGEGQAPTEKVTEFDDILPELILNIIDQIPNPFERMKMAGVFQYGLKRKIKDPKRREEFHQQLVKIVHEAQEELGYKLDEQEAEQITALDFKFIAPFIYFEIKNETDQKVEVAGDKQYELQPGKSVSFRKGMLNKKDVVTGGSRAVQYADMTDNYNPLPTINSFFEVGYNVAFSPLSQKIDQALLGVSIVDKSGSELKDELDFDGSLGEDDIKRFKIVIVLHQDGTQSVDIVELK